jgi:hypothetical protein
MIRGDRPVLPNFDEAEALYLRYFSDQFVDGLLSTAAIRFPKQSVNRGLQSEPEDCLFSEQGIYNGVGVVGFQIADVPPKVSQPQGPAYIFFLKHVPLPDNYAHSEIWSDHEPGTGDYREPGKTVKHEFRVRLCQRIGLDNIRIAAERSSNGAITA